MKNTLVEPQELETAATIDSKSPEELENFIVGENENKNTNQNEIVLNDDTEGILKSTQNLLESDLRAPERFALKFDKKMSIDEKFAQLEKKNDKYEIKMADYESKLNSDLKDKIEPKIEALYQKAMEKAEQFSNMDKELAERSITLENYHQKATKSWEEKKIDEKQFTSLINEITKEKDSLEENKNFQELLKEEVENENTIDNEAQLIQFGRYLIETKNRMEKDKETQSLVESFQKRIDSAKSVNSYINKYNVNYEGVNDIMDEAIMAGLVREKTIYNKKNPETGRWEELEKPFTILVPENSHAKILIEDFKAKKKEIYENMQAYKKIQKEIDEKVKNGWIRYGKKGAVNVTKIQKNGHYNWLVDTMGDTGDFEPGNYDRLPQWLYKIVTENKKKNPENNNN